MVLPALGRTSRMQFAAEIVGFFFIHRGLGVTPI